MTDTRTKSIKLFGEDFDLKLNAGSLRLAQMEGEGIDSSAMQDLEDFDLGMRLAYIGLLPSLQDGRTEEEVVREIIQSGRADEIASWALGEYLQMQNELGKSLKAKVKEMEGALEDL